MKETLNFEKIEEWRKIHNLSKKAFCELCKIPYNAYRKILAGNLKFDIKYLFRIAKIMDIEIYKLFKNL